MADRTRGQRLVLIENARSFGSGFRLHLGFMAAFTGVIVVTSVLPWLALKWFIIGLSSGVALVMLAVMVTRPTDPAVRGQWAEEWSRTSLRNVKGWMVTHNLPFDGYDVDHVAVTPSTVLAVETKYRGKVSTPAYAQRRHQRELRSAQEAARKLGLFLRSKNIGQPCPVTPLLMAWGPGRPLLELGWERDGDVYVVDAEHPELWSHLFATPDLSTQLRHAVHTAVRAYAATRAKHDAQRQAPLLREMSVAFRRGLKESRNERIGRRALRQALQHGLGAHPSDDDVSRADRVTSQRSSSLNRQPSGR